MASDRFDFEQKLLECWGITKDIDELFEYVCETPSAEVSQDKVANILLGLKQLYDLRFNTTFNMFEELVKQNKI